MKRVAVIVPNWNGKDVLATCLGSLLTQSEPAEIIVVENGSNDGSLEFLQANFPDVQLVVNSKNLGFAGGVNSGICEAMEIGYEFVALFNNDAIADKDWLKRLVEVLDVEKEYGIVTGRLLSGDNLFIDSTGENYTNWGLPYPRGRGEPVSDKYDKLTNVFAASGGASLYRVKMLAEIGLFDADFFAYYEDVDISFRAQLSAWQVRYVPGAIAYHQIGATSGKIRGFTTQQTMRNLPMLMIKNVPQKFAFRIGWRFWLAYSFFFVRAFTRGHGWAALKGWGQMLVLLPKKLGERRQVQSNRKVSNAYIWAMMTHDLPPNATALRKLRSVWWKMIKKEMDNKNNGN